MADNKGKAVEFPTETIKSEEGGDLTTIDMTKSGEQTRSGESPTYSFESEGITPLKEDYVDDRLDSSVNTQRRFVIKDHENGDATVQADAIIEEITEFETQGDQLGAADINTTNQRVNMVTDEVFALANSMGDIDENLTASDDTVFKFTKSGNKYGYLDANGNFNPFNKGAIYLGEYSANTSINVSDLGATSVNQFVLCTPAYNFQTRSSEIDGTLYTYDNTVYAGSLSLSGNTLTITVPRSRMQMFQQWADPRQIPHWDISMNLSCKLYFVGDVQSRS